MLCYIKFGVVGHGAAWQGQAGRDMARPERVTARNRRAFLTDARFAI